jgi:AcrR family transcriptional regulator
MGTGAVDTTEAILDAARQSVLDFGIRRTTLSDVARRAGVSRMTVYRRYPDVRSLLRELMTREFGALFAEIGTRVEGPDVRRRLVASLVTIVREMRAHPLFTKVFAAEPELLLPYVVERLGDTQKAGIELVLGAVGEGQADGSIRDGDPAVITHGLLLVTQSFVFSAGIAGGPPADAMLAELARLLDGALRP